MSAILLLHIFLGSAGLLAGLAAMIVRKRRGLHTRAGDAYHWLVLGTAVTGVVLSFVDLSTRWQFILLGGLMYGFAFVAYRAAKRRRPRWLLVHAPCQIASYFFMVEAVVITNWQRLTFGHDIPNGYAWLLPSLVFYPLIGLVIFRVRRSLGPAGVKADPLA